MELEKKYKNWLQKNKVKSASKQYIDFIHKLSKEIDLNLFNIVSYNDSTLLERFEDNKKTFTNNDRSWFRKFIKFASESDLLEEFEFVFDAIKIKQTTENLALHHFDKNFGEILKIVDKKFEKPGEKAGYDILVETKLGQQYHIEIKGLRSKRKQIIMTAHEFEIASKDDKYIICIVSNCKSKSSTVDIEFYKRMENEKWINVKIINENWINKSDQILYLNPFQYQGKTL